jgi:glucosamine-6-phosphate deaminase
MIKIFENEKILAQSLALEILMELKKKKYLVLGCPGGRSLKKTYYYLGIISHKLNINLDNLTIVMMDEYVHKKNDRYKLANPDSHFSCVRFSKHVIKKLLNYKKNNLNSLKDKNIFSPTIDLPEAYDLIIKKLGGIDIFLLASGSSDGHVAFNNYYSKINQRTHITKLSSKTRSDNMRTFPNFKKLSEVPQYGLTVGLKTISSLSKRVILVLSGKEKRLAFKKLSGLKKFNISWPASIIFKCKKYKIYADKIAKH